MSETTAVKAPEFRWDWPKQKLLVEDGEVGDCWRCCIAAILQVPAESVPHFVKESRSVDADTQRWLNERGFWLMYADGERGLCLPKWGGDPFPSPPLIACGPTVRSKKMGQHHAVVMVDGKLVYDPHPWSCGLLAITEQYVLVPTNYALPVPLSGEEAMRAVE